MKLRALLALGGAAALAAWWYVVAGTPEGAPGSTAAVSATAAAERAQALGTAHRAPSADGTSAPRTTSVPALPPLPAPKATLFNELLASRQYRALYERLKNSPEGETAEGKLVLYEILRQCATVTEGRRPGYRATQPKRDDFVAGIAATDPQRERRIAAYDAFFADRCGGLSAVSITQSDLMRLLGDSAALGDPRAKALALEQELWAARRSGPGRDGGVTLTDAQIDSLRQAMSTRDPEAIRVAGRVLANSWHDYQLRVGSSQQPVEPRALMNAFLVLACEYGAPCGADTPRMQQACAFQGHCEAQTYPEYLFYYGSTPHDAELLVQYRSLVRTGIETGDWSAFTVIRGLPPPANRMTFVPGPR